MLVILDRDGVINQDSLDYIKSPAEFIPLPGSLEAIARLTRAGYRVAVATNQSGLARGYYDVQGLASIHQKMYKEIEAVGGCIDYVAYCPHMPDAGCSCRKPKPGLLLEIAALFGVSSLEKVPFIGDRVSDIQAAQAAGALPMMVLSSMTDRKSLLAYPNVPVFNSLSQCVDYLLSQR